MWLCGWAEGGAGNLSIRVDAPGRAADPFEIPGGRWTELPCSVPVLGGAAILITARGSRFRTLGRNPAAGAGVMVLDKDGKSYKVIQGFEQGGEPSSEFRMHLEAHAALAQARGGRERVVLHVHPPRLLALSATHGRRGGVDLTRLLWGVHGECVALFPEGVEVLAWAPPGSGPLAGLTEKALSRRRLLIWPHHGVVSAGRDLEEAFDLIEAGEKAAGLYLEAVSSGAKPELLESGSLLEIARGTGVAPDPAVLGRQPSWKGE